MSNTSNNFQYHLYSQIDLLPARLKKTQFLTCYMTETPLYTISAEHEQTYLSLSGAGILFYVTHYGKGVPCYNMSHQIKIDDEDFDGGVFAIGIDAAESYQFNSAGTLYCLGTSALLNRIWDTTNHEYYVINFNLSYEFSSSAEFKLCNYDSSNDSDQKARVVLRLYVSSRRLKFHSKRFWGEAVHEIRDMINRKFGSCSAVISDFSIDRDINLKDKEKGIYRLTLYVGDEIYRIKKDEIINALIKENLVYNIIEKPKKDVKVGR